MKKIIIPAVLATAFLTVPFSQTVDAQSTENNYVESSTQKAGEEKVIQAFLVEEGGLKEISLSEYNDLMNDAVTSPPVVSSVGPRIPEKGSVSPSFDTPGSIVTSRKFINVTNQKQQLHTYLKKDMSDWVKNSSKTTVVSQAVTWSNTYSWAATASIGGNWTNALAPVLGANWQTTKTYSYADTFTVQPGYKAKLQFTPIYKEATGDLVGLNYQNTILERVNNVTVKTPVTLEGGKVQGVVSVVEAKL